jgi:hypothetical protein
LFRLLSQARFGSNIRLRHDSYQLLLVVDNHQSAYLMFAHQLYGFTYIRIRAATYEIRGHYGIHTDLVRVFSGGHHPAAYITIRYNSDQFSAFSDWHKPNIDIAHLLRRILDAIAH